MQHNLYPADVHPCKYRKEDSLKFAYILRNLYPVLSVTNSPKLSFFSLIQLKVVYLNHFKNLQRRFFFFFFLFAWIICVMFVILLMTNDASPTYWLQFWHSRGYKEMKQGPRQSERLGPQAKWTSGPLNIEIELFLWTYRDR